LRKAEPPIIAGDVHEFVDVVFGNILDLRECNRRLLEVMRVRQREQAPVIQQIGDVFLSAAAEFRVVYPIYVGNLPLAEKRMKDEVEANSDFRLFLEVGSAQRFERSTCIQLAHLLLMASALRTRSSRPSFGPQALYGPAI